MIDADESDFRISRCCQQPLQFIGGLGGFWYSRSTRRQYGFCPGCDLVYAVRIPDEIHEQITGEKPA